MEQRLISFNEELHKYTDENSSEYKSVTTVIGGYVPEFDKEYWSKYKAAQLGVTQEEILKDWAKTNKKSIVRGNKIHKELEDGIAKPIEISNEEVVRNTIKRILLPRVTTLEEFLDSPLKAEYPSIYETILGFLKLGWVCYPEFRVYSSLHFIAGTIDCLLIKGGEIVVSSKGVIIKDAEFKILDWKTNKDKLSFQSGYFKKKNGVKTDEFVRKLEYMDKPLDYIENCKGSIYTLQLSLYAKILELWGNTCQGLALYHIRPKMKPQLFKLPYWSESCDIMLHDRSSKLILN